MILKSYMVDDNYSNAYTTWKKMGLPQDVSEDQFKTLQKAGRLSQNIPVKEIQVINGELKYHLTLHGQAVTLLKLNW